MMIIILSQSTQPSGIHPDILLAISGIQYINSARSQNCRPLSFPPLLSLKLTLGKDIWAHAIEVYYNSYMYTRRFIIPTAIAIYQVVF